MISTLDHLIIAVKDLDAAEENYTKIFGQPPVWRGEHKELGTSNSLFNFNKTALYAASDKVSPPNVNEKKISSINRIISRRPAIADSGNPLASPFPKVAKSWVMSNNSCAPPFENRKPVITSSNIKTALFLCVIDLTFFKKSSWGYSTFMGSIITAATCRFNC